MPRKTLAYPESPSSNSWRALALGAITLFSGAIALLILRTPSPPPVSEPMVVAQFDFVEIPVPLVTIPAGTRVDESMITSLRFPLHQLPDDIIRSPSDLLLLTTLVPLPEGLPVARKNVTTNSGGPNAVTQQIPPGMRAIAIKVDATSAVEGWATSGSLVDVIVVTNQETRVIAENVRVLSSERSVTSTESATASVPSTVTLLVEKDQVLAITTAVPLGRIQLALRGNTDTHQWEVTRLSADTLRNASSSARAKVQGTMRTRGKSYVLINDIWQKVDEDAPQLSNQRY
jgi:pilus assembly protein CpaB